MDENRTEYADDALRIENGTSPDEIRRFVRRRVENPIQRQGVTVWDFNNHVPNMEALERTIEDGLHRDEYIIPFQASGVWGYIFTFLPQPLRETELLGYSQAEGEYIPFPNYYRHSNTVADSECTNELQSILLGL